MTDGYEGPLLALWQSVALATKAAFWPADWKLASPFPTQ